MTARSTSLIRLSPRTTLGISQLRPSRMLGSPRTVGTDAVSHPGWLRSASSAICVSSALLFPAVTGGRGLRVLWRSCSPLRQQPEALGDDPVEGPLGQHGYHELPHRIRRDHVAHLGV